MSDMGSAQRAPGSEPSRQGGDQGEEKSGLHGLLVICAGALLTALVVAFALGLNPGSSNDAKLTAIAVSELDAAASTLLGSQATQRVADAKTCKAPLAVLTVVKQGGSPDTTIRIRSGDYVSPPFVITDKPQQIAVPFPAPYPVGKGVMSVLGEGKDITVWMTPGWTIPTLAGTATQNVHWDTKPNC
jgi:hypothetical protein